MTLSIIHTFEYCGPTNLIKLLLVLKNIAWTLFMSMEHVGQQLDDRHEYEKLLLAWMKNEIHE